MESIDHETTTLLKELCTPRYTKISMALTPDCLRLFSKIYLRVEEWSVSWVLRQSNHIVVPSPSLVVFNK